MEAWGWICLRADWTWQSEKQNSLAYVPVRWRNGECAIACEVLLPKDLNLYLTKTLNVTVSLEETGDRQVNNTKRKKNQTNPNWSRRQMTHLLQQIKCLREKKQGEWFKKIKKTKWSYFEFWFRLTIFKNTSLKQKM